jgi:hypothetical protein
MALRKVTFFDSQGPAVEPVDEEGQAKPCVFGVRWVNPDTFETIRVRGGKRTGPKGEPLEEIPPTPSLSPFDFDEQDGGPAGRSNP